MSRQAVRSNLLARVLAGLVAFAVPSATVILVAAECEVLNLNLSVPDPATLKLSDGDHVIASAPATKGRLEVKVTVKGKDISENRYYLGGRLMRNTPETAVPKEVRECGAPKRSAFPSVQGWLASAGRALRDWLETPLEARTTPCVILDQKCGDAVGGGGYCCVLVRCGGATGHYCTGY
jgi:hypothetical protein